MIQKSEKEEIKEKFINDVINIQNPMGFNLDQPCSIRRLLLETKQAIDRWDFVTRYLILNPIHKKDIMIQIALGILGSNEYEDDFKSTIYLWGLEVIFSDKLPPCTCVGFSKVESLVHSELPKLTIFKVLNEEVVVSRCSATEIKNDIDFEIINKIKTHNNTVCINPKVVPTIYSHPEFEIGNIKEIKSGLIGRFDNIKVFESAYVEDIIYCNDEFDLNEFNNDKWMQNQVIKNIIAASKDKGGVCINISSFIDIVNIPNYNMYFKPVTLREILQTGYYGDLLHMGKSIKIICNKNCKENEFIPLPNEITDNYSLQSFLDYLNTLSRGD